MPELSIEFRLIVAVLATYRLAQLISKDDGPLDVFARVRRLAAIMAGYWQANKFNPNVSAEKQLWARWLHPLFKSLADLLACPYCSGVWMAAGCIWLVSINHPAGNLFLLWMAVAGGQAFLQDVSQ